MRFENKKKPLRDGEEALIINRRRPTFPPLKAEVSLAQVGLTTLFGKGRGGPHRHSHLKKVNKLRVKFELTRVIIDNVNNVLDRKLNG